MKISPRQRVQCVHTVAVTSASFVAYVAYVFPTYALLVIPASLLASLIWIWFE